MCIRYYYLLVIKYLHIILDQYHSTYMQTWVKYLFEYFMMNDEYSLSIWNRYFLKSILNVLRIFFNSRF